jgi:hypothetical protein
MRRFLAALAATAIITGSLGAPSALAAESKPTAILFKDIDGRGASVQVDSAITDLGGKNFNDTASSIFVVSGKFEVCKDFNFKGTCQTFGQGLHNLGSLSDAVTSIRPVGASAGNGDSGSGVILLFTDKDGNGKVVRLTSSVKNLSDYAGFNDTVSSVAIFKGSWKLCKSKDYGGSCTTLTSGVYNLESFDNAISSLRVQTQ